MPPPDTCTEPGPWCEGTAYGWRPDLATGALAYAGRPLSVCRILLGGLVPPVCATPLATGAG